MSGIAVVCRDGNGRIIEGLGRRLQAEALTLKNVVLMARRFDESGLEVVIENDAALLCKPSRILHSYQLGRLLQPFQRCCILCQPGQMYRFFLLSANRVADWLAKAARCRALSHCWISNPLTDL